MTLIKDLLEKKEIDYWDFKETKNEGLHKICSYPATMVPDMQNELIKTVLEIDSSVDNILDPFYGSGVTLVEGKKLGLKPIGIDINPMAYLICKVKLQGIDKSSTVESNKKIRSILYDKDFEHEIHEFKKITKWFRKDIIKSLSKVRAAIISEKDLITRQYYWVCLIDIVKRYSNTRSSTFKLHVKNEKDIISMKNNVITDFIKKINEFIEFMPSYDKECGDKLCLGNALKILSDMENNSVDLICTSPPYGENATTVTYGQYSMLPLYWFDLNDIKYIDKSILSNYSSIDTASLGGGKCTTDYKNEIPILNLYLSKIDRKKQKKVKNFICDYINVLDKLTIILKPNKYMILTLGNRRVDNQILPLTEITKSFLRERNLKVQVELSRNIINKRIPKKISNVKNHAVSSMNREYIIILRKDEEAC